jgi:hypothetical protein
MRLEPIGIWLLICREIHFKSGQNEFFAMSLTPRNFAFLSHTSAKSKRYSKRIRAVIKSSRWCWLMKKGGSKTSWQCPFKLKNGLSKCFILAFCLRKQDVTIKFLLVYLWYVWSCGGSDVIPVHSLKEGMRPKVGYAVLTHPARITTISCTHKERTPGKQFISFTL